MMALVGSLLSLFPVCVADGSSSSAMSSSTHKCSDDMEIEVEAVASEEGLNMGLVEIMVIHGKLKPGVVDWLLACTTKPNHRLNQSGMACSDLGSRLVRLHRALLLKLYRDPGK